MPSHPVNTGLRSHAGYRTKLCTFHDALSHTGSRTHTYSTHILCILILLKHLPSEGSRWISCSSKVPGNTSAHHICETRENSVFRDVKLIIFPKCMVLSMSLTYLCGGGGCHPRWFTNCLEAVSATSVPIRTPIPTLSSSSSTPPSSSTPS